ncbi:MAG: alkaline phosphatase family protein [Elusimicrobiales bacterium]|nr:alkaline phosphatase family protein [Elusimicrobiales bacterium]
MADKAVEVIKEKDYDFMLINFANGDMVGHTGDFNAAKKAVEVVDECVGKVVGEALKKDYVVMITADHGNSEEMWDYKINMPKTSHTTNPVEFILVGNKVKNIKLRERGILSDIAVTIIDFLGIKKPKDMTSESLIMRN